MSLARQPEGIPTGGQFAATTHAEPALTLQSEVAPAAAFYANRDIIRERRDRVQEQAARLERLAQAYAVKGLATEVMSRYPKATSMALVQKRDNDHQYDVIDLRGADGKVIVHVDNSDDWIHHYDQESNGSSLQEMADDLNTRDDRWADGIARISIDNWRGKVASINLQAALESPLPEASTEDDPYTRAFNLDEQQVLIDTAKMGLEELDDRTGRDRAGDYSPAELEQMRGQYDVAESLLINTGSQH